MAIDFTGSEIARLQSGRTVRKPLANSRQDGFFGGTGWALIDAPADVVWAALQDWEAYDDVFPQTVGATELSSKDNRSVVLMELGYRIFSVKYELDVSRDNKNRTMSFGLAENRPHDIESARGYWRVFPQKDGRTLLEYAISVQLPAGLANLLSKRLQKELEDSLVGLPRYVKKWVEGPSGNRYRQMTAKN